METRRNLKRKKAASALTVAKILKLKRAAMEAKRVAMVAKRMALSAVDVGKILRLKKEATEAVETKCFPLTARAKLAAAAGQSGAEEDKVPEMKKKKKKKVVTHLVSQGYIDYMKEAGLFHCVDEIPEEELAKRSELFREGYLASVLLNEKLQACQQVLLDQYDAFGYAYDAKEVTDDEGEDEDVVVEN